jgi:hypothetical protein
MARISAPEMSVSSGTRPSPGKNQTMIQGTLTSMPTEPSTDSSNGSPRMPSATKPITVPAPRMGAKPCHCVQLSAAPARSELSPRKWCTTGPAMGALRT